MQWLDIVTIGILGVMTLIAGIWLQKIYDSTPQEGDDDMVPWRKDEEDHTYCDEDTLA